METWPVTGTSGKDTAPWKSLWGSGLCSSRQVDTPQHNPVSGLRSDWNRQRIRVLT